MSKSALYSVGGIVGVLLLLAGMLVTVLLVEFAPMPVP